ncbi:MAG TPA: YceD family protein [Sphingopyxis sp.]|nr:YceD family protein [Sphingopyxis sp.]
MTADGFSHVVTLAAAAQGQSITLTADAAARESIAARLGLISLERLEADAEVRAVAGGLAVRGEVRAEAVQRCAAPDLPVPAAIAEPFDLKFLRDAGPGREEEEIELGAEEIDILPLEHDRVDIGEVAVQTLSLALDPYPRHPDADHILAEKGVLSEEQAGPFAALAALKGGNKA